MKGNQKLVVALAVCVLIGGTGLTVRHYRHVAQARTARVERQRMAKRIAKQNASISRQINQNQYQAGTSVNQHLTTLLKANHFVGSALVIKNNRVLYQRGFGYANKAQGLKNQPQSTYQILSIQKSITAVGIMQLVACGKVKLSDPISKYYPNLKAGGSTTIRDMLDMTTGFWLNQADWSKQPLSEAKTVAYAVKHVTYRPQKAGRFNYSAVNFLLLAGVIRQQSGHSYRHFVETQVIKPLKLTHTGFVADGLGPTATLGYADKAGKVKPTYQQLAKETAAQMHDELGTGQMYMSPHDLYRFESAVLKGKLLKPADVATLHTRTATGEYGGGVYNMSNGIRSHGVGYGYESDIHLSPDGKTAVVLLSNYRRRSAGIQIAANKIFSELMSGKL